MVIKIDFYTFSIILLDVHVIRGQSQDRAFREHARISLNLAHRGLVGQTLIFGLSYCEARPSPKNS